MTLVFIRFFPFWRPLWRSSGCCLWCTWWKFFHCPFSYLPFILLEQLVSILRVSLHLKCSMPQDAYDIYTHRASKSFFSLSLFFPLNSLTFLMIYGFGVASFLPGVDVFMPMILDCRSVIDQCVVFVLSSSVDSSCVGWTLLLPPLAAASISSLSP